MSLRILEGFNTFSSAADVGLVYTGTPTGSPTPASLQTGRRSGTKCLRCAHSGTKTMLYQILDSQTTWVVGAAFRRDAVNIYNDDAIIKISTSAGEQISVRLTSDKYLRVSRNGTTLWTANTAAYKLEDNTWVYVEFKVTINGSTGSWALRVNGSAASEVTQSSVNTAGQGGTTADRIAIQGMASAGASACVMDITDVYILDGTATDGLNNFLGDCRVDPLKISADGAVEEFTPSTGVDSAAMVDDMNAGGTIDSDSTYISSTTQNHVSTFVTDNMPYTPSAVYGVKAACYAKKDASGTRELTNVLRIGGTNYAGATHALSTTYAPIQDTFSLNPADNAAFEKADVDGLELGVKVVT